MFYVQDINIFLKLCKVESINQNKHKSSYIKMSIEIKL